MKFCNWCTLMTGAVQGINLLHIKVNKVLFICELEQIWKLSQNNIGPLHSRWTEILNLSFEGNNASLYICYIPMTTVSFSRQLFIYPLRYIRSILSSIYNKIWIQSTLTLKRNFKLNQCHLMFLFFLCCNFATAFQNYSFIFNCKLISKGVRTDTY